MINRLHHYLHARHSGYETLSIPPFTLFLDASGKRPYRSCALIDKPAEGELASALEAVKAAFRQRNIAPCVRCIDTFSPTLGSALENNGFQQLEESLLMVCTPATYRPAPAMPGLSTIMLSKDSELDDVRQGLQTHSLGFAPQETQALTTDPDLFRRTLTNSRAFMLRLNGEPVTTGMFTDVVDGVTELVAISTVPEHRRRGFGAYLTGYMAQIAFTRQVDIVFILVPNDQNANVYKRVGFQTYATLLTYGATA